MKMGKVRDPYTVDNFGVDQRRLLKIFDFDGTLVDLWPRFYAVFCNLSRADVSLDEYREAKRRLKRDEDVAEGLGVTLPSDYFERKAELLEDKEYLKLDKLLFTPDELVRLLFGNSLILTKRRNEENFKWELDRLGISCDYKVLTSRDEDTKLRWEEENIKTPAMVIGDSVDDIRLEQIDGVKAVAVGYGLSNRADFEGTGLCFEYAEYPDEVIEAVKRIEIMKK